MRLKGEGPKFYPKTALQELGFSPTSGDYFLGFEIKSFEPVPGIDPHSYQLERTGRQIALPYFTAMEKIRGK